MAARLASCGFLLFFVLLWLAAAEWGTTTTTTTTCQAAKIMIKPSDPYPLVQQVARCFSLNRFFSLASDQTTDPGGGLRRGVVARWLTCIGGGGFMQVHIAYGELASEMVVMWSSAIEADNSSFVLFGSKPGAYTHHQVATNWNFTAADANPDGLQYLHRAVLTVRGGG
jgi:hypothetical protein